MQLVADRLPEEWRGAAPYIAAVPCVAVSAVLGKAVVGIFQRWRVRAAAEARRAIQKKRVVYLFGFPRTSKVAQLSAPVAMVETYLRAAKIPYVFVPTADLSMSPTGRFPYIELDGQGTADSQVIIDRLKVEYPTFVRENVGTVDESDSALTTFVRRTMYGSLRNGYARHAVVDNTAAVAERFRELLPGMPAVAFNMMIKSFRKGAISMLNAEGHGDLSDDEYQSELQRDLRSIEVLLETRSGPRKFALGGTQPTEVDTSLFGWLVLLQSYDLPGFDLTRTGAIKQYLQHVRETLYPDYAKLCSPAQVGIEAPPTPFNDASLCT